MGTPERDATVYAAVGARLGLEIPVFGEGIFARIHVDPILPITRTTLKNRGVEYWTAPPVSAALAIGVVGQF